MYFYALFGLSLFSKNQFLTVAGTTIALIGLMFANAGIADPGLHAFLSNPIYYEFAFGLVLGVLYNTRPKLFTARKLLAAAALFSAVFIVNTPLHFPMDLLLGPIAPIRFWLWGIPAALIVAWGAGLPALRGRVGQMLLLLGNASYALYLSHFFVMKAFNKVLQYEAVRALPQIIVGPVVFVSCCLLAVGLHLLIEKPIARFFARLRKSAAARRPVQATPQVAA
jgi:peptidoglycan/LPS O-acetylase OafA/YrhL